jgi:hypothetical protein
MLGSEYWMVDWGEEFPDDEFWIKFSVAHSKFRSLCAVFGGEAGIFAGGYWVCREWCVR